MSQQNFAASATHLYCLVCSHPAAQTGEVSPAHTRCVARSSSVRRTQGWGTRDHRSVILPSKVPGQWQSIYPQPKWEPEGLFVAILEGFPACIQAGSLLGRWECSQDQLEHSQGISDLCWRKLRAEVSCGLLWLDPSPTGPLQFTGSALCLGGMSQQAGQ